MAGLTDAQRGPDALAAIAAEPPSYAVERVAEAVATWFGLTGRLVPLVSERDQNFCLVTPANERFLVKISGALESAATTTFQLAVLSYLETQSDVPAPRVVHTLNGDDRAHIGSEGTRHALRLLSWVEGEQLAAVGINSGLAGRFGAALGQLDAALAGFDYTGPNPVLLWDLQRVCELQPLLGCIEDEPLRRSVAMAIDDFARHVVPVSAGLAQQVIHGDANPENVLVRDASLGFIDFGDIVRAPRVFDLAIAASYLRPRGDDCLEMLRPFVGAYQAVVPLEPDETRLLFDLVRARLATSVTLLFWRLQARPADDPYRQKSQDAESSTSHFLVALDALGRDNFIKEINGLVNG